MLPVTVLSDYLYCPRKIYLRYVLKFMPVTNAPVVKGKIKHDVFDAISKTEEEIILGINPSNLNNIDTIYKQVYRKLLTNSISKFEDDIKKAEMDKEKLFDDSLKKFLDEATYKSKTMFNLIKQVGLFGKDLLNALPMKQESEISVYSKRLRLKGIIDRVEIINGDYIPVELKTGSMPRDGIWPGHRVQLASYILLLNERFKSNYGFVEYMDHDVRRKVVMNPFLESEVRGLINKVYNVLESDNIPDVCDNPNKCGSCNFRSRCFPTGSV